LGLSYLKKLTKLYESNSIHSKEYLESLSRVDLQRIAKAQGVKANLKSNEIIKIIAEQNAKFNDRVSENKVKVSSPSNNDASKSSIDIILADQGIGMKDLIRLQAMVTGSKKDKGKLDKCIIKHDTDNYSSIDKSFGDIGNIAYQSPLQSIQKKSSKAITLQKNNLDSFKESLNAETVVKKIVKASDDRYDYKPDKVNNVKPKGTKPFRAADKKENLPVSLSSSSSRVNTTGIKLQTMLEHLVTNQGFGKLYDSTGVRAFKENPSISSSLKALRQPSMEWARKKIEYLYIKSLK
jgi:hypothetical protein